MVLEENGENAAVCAGPPSPGGSEETSSSQEAMMDIDAECTSSEARLLTCGGATTTEATTGPASTSTDASRLLDQDGLAASEKGDSCFL